MPRRCVPGAGPEPRLPTTVNVDRGRAALLQPPRTPLTRDTASHRALGDIGNLGNGLSQGLATKQEGSQVRGASIK